jgi:hypothetical protein
MADQSRWFEISLTAIGLAVTAILGYGQLRVSEAQHDQAARQQVEESKRAVDNIEVQVMSLVAPHLGNLAKQSGDFKSSQKVVLAAAEYLSTKHNRTALASMAAKISENNQSVPIEVRTRIQEATEAVSPAGKWFAVLASLPASDLPAAKEVANKKLKQAQSVAPGTSVKIYKTKLSNNFAIVLEGPVERKKALDLALLARSSTLAKDAFAQQDREWVTVGTAPFE